MPVGTSSHSLANFVRHSLVPIGLSGARWSASTEALCWHTAFATPMRVWVIQTKYRRVSKKSFSKVLSRIAANTDTVRQWVPAGMPVRGCLVLAYETEIKRRDYSHRDEKITAYTPVLLMREMRCEAQKNGRSMNESRKIFGSSALRQTYPHPLVQSGVVLISCFIGAGFVRVLRP